MPCSLPQVHMQHWGFDGMALRSHEMIVPFRDQWICYKDYPLKATVLQASLACRRLL